MSKSLPSQPNLEHLKAQAKTLLSDFKNASPEAIQKAQTYLPALSSFPLEQAQTYPLALHDAQSIIAREYGFESWTKLKQFVESSSASSGETTLMELALNDSNSSLEEAQTLLSEQPSLGEASIYTACLTGNLQAVERFLNQEPSLVNAKGGSREMEPLMYVCASCFLRSPERFQSMLQIARLLLARGANPNASVIYKQYPDSPLSALYFAIGLHNKPALGRLLLEAGATPNDNESLYHSCEHRDHEALKLLIEFNANPNNTNALKRMLDYDDLEGLKLLLEHKADPNEGGSSAIHHAIKRGRKPEFVEMLLDYGADPNRKEESGDNGYEIALRYGKPEIADVFARRGAQTEVSPATRLLAACLSGDEAGARRLLEQNPDLITGLTARDQEMMAEAAQVGNAPAVKLMLSLGFDPGFEGTEGGTPLHWGAWHGNVEIVEPLVSHTKLLSFKDKRFQATPLGWAQHGSLFCDGEQESNRHFIADYAQVVKLLLEAGSTLSDPNFGSEEVKAVIQAFQADKAS